MFETKRLPSAVDEVAPDGSNVRALLGLEAGRMAHFELPVGAISKAVVHKTVAEIWYFLGGRGELWRKLGDREETVVVDANTCITIPCGTHFQFRALGDRPLSAVAVTMPPWPGDDEAEFVSGRW